MAPLLRRPPRAVAAPPTPMSFGRGKGRTGTPPPRPTGSAAAAPSLPADGAVARRALAVLEPPLQTPAARPGRRHQKADALGLDGADNGGAATGGLHRDPVGGTTLGRPGRPTPVPTGRRSREAGITGTAPARLRQPPGGGAGAAAAAWPL